MKSVKISNLQKDLDIFDQFELDLEDRPVVRWWKNQQEQTKHDAFTSIDYVTSEIRRLVNEGRRGRCMKYIYKLLEYENFTIQEVFRLKRMLSYLCYKSSKKNLQNNLVKMRQKGRDILGFTVQQLARMHVIVQVFHYQLNIADGSRVPMTPKSPISVAQLSTISLARIDSTDYIVDITPKQHKQRGAQKKAVSYEQFIQERKARWTFYQEEFYSLTLKHLIQAYRYFRAINNTEMSLMCLKKGKQLCENLPEFFNFHHLTEMVGIFYQTLGNVYLQLLSPDIALEYFQKAFSNYGRAIQYYMKKIERLDIKKITLSLDLKTERVFVQMTLLLWSMASAHEMKSDHTKTYETIKLAKFFSDQCLIYEQQTNEVKKNCNIFYERLNAQLSSALSLQGDIMRIAVSIFPELKQGYFEKQQRGNSNLDFYGRNLYQKFQYDYINKNLMIKQKINMDSRNSTTPEHKEEQSPTRKRRNSPKKTTFQSHKRNSSNSGQGSQSSTIIIETKDEQPVQPSENKDLDNPDNMIIKQNLNSEVVSLSNSHRVENQPESELNEKVVQFNLDHLSGSNNQSFRSSTMMNSDVALGTIDTSVGIRKDYSNVGGKDIGILSATNRSVLDLSQPNSFLVSKKKKKPTMLSFLNTSNFPGPTINNKGYLSSHSHRENNSNNEFFSRNNSGSGFVSLNSPQSRPQTSLVKSASGSEIKQKKIVEPTLEHPIVYTISNKQKVYKPQALTTNKYFDDKEYEKKNMDHLVINQILKLKQTFYFPPQFLDSLNLREVPLGKMEQKCGVKNLDFAMHDLISQSIYQGGQGQKIIPEQYQQKFVGFLNVMNDEDFDKKEFGTSKKYLKLQKHSIHAEENDQNKLVNPVQERCNFQQQHNVQAVFKIIETTELEKNQNMHSSALQSMLNKQLNGGEAEVQNLNSLSGSSKALELIQQEGNGSASQQNIKSSNAITSLTNVEQLNKEKKQTLKNIIFSKKQILGLKETYIQSKMSEKHQIRSANSERFDKNNSTVIRSLLNQNADPEKQSQRLVSPQIIEEAYQKSSNLVNKMLMEAQETQFKTQMQDKRKHQAIPETTQNSSHFTNFFGITQKYKDLSESTKFFHNKNRQDLMELMKISKQTSDSKQNVSADSTNPPAQKIERSMKSKRSILLTYEPRTDDA